VSIEGDSVTEQRIVSVGGIRFAVRAANDELGGPCVVFLHGILGTVNFWPELLPQDLKNSLRHCSISLPHHLPAESQKRTAAFDLQQLPEMLLTVIEEQISDQPVSLVGWSTGAFAALQLAAAFPQRFQSVLGFAGFSIGKWRGLLGQLQQLASGGSVSQLLARVSLRFLQSSSRLSMLANQTAANERHAFARDSNARYLLENEHKDFRKYNPSDICEFMGAIRRFDMTPELSKIECPVTLVAGQQDSIIRYEHAEQLASSIPSSRLITLPNTGHTFFTDPERRYEQILREWIADNGYASSRSFAA